MKKKRIANETDNVIDVSCGVLKNEYRKLMAYLELLELKYAVPEIYHVHKPKPEETEERY